MITTIAKDKCPPNITVKNPPNSTAQISQMSSFHYRQKSDPQPKKGKYHKSDPQPKKGKYRKSDPQPIKSKYPTLLKTFFTILFTVILQWHYSDFAANFYFVLTFSFTDQLFLPRQKLPLVRLPLLLYNHVSAIGLCS